MASAPPAVAALTEGVVRRMLLNKVHRTAGLMLLAVLGIGLALRVAPGLAQESPQPAGAAAPAKGRPGPKPADDPARAGRIYFHSHLTLVRAAPDGKSEEELPRLAEKQIFAYQTHSARLSPDGKTVAFGTAVVKDENGQLMTHAPDKIFHSDLTKKAPAKVLVEMPGSGLDDWCWSPDGRKLAFTSWDKEGGHNWVVDVKSKKVQRLRLPLFKLEGKEYEMGVQAWSPDGKSLLAAGDGFHLVNADGSGARRLTADSKTLLSGTCRFSPDGRKVLYSGFPGDPRKDRAMTLYVLDVATGKVRPVVEAKNFTNLRGCWSPDGRRIAYRVSLLDAQGEYAGESAIYVTDLDGRNHTTVVRDRHQPGLIRFSLLGWRRQ
jgi:dipeptidyl aminopeptidase/acylaminoacyl peptidase